MPKSVEALRIFYTSFSISEKFRGTELMCLPSLPRLRSQTRHIPALCLFILKFVPKSRLPAKNRCFSYQICTRKIFLHPMTQNLHTKHGSYERGRTREPYTYREVTRAQKLCMTFDSFKKKKVAESSHHTSVQILMKRVNRC